MAAQDATAPTRDGVVGSMTARHDVRTSRVHEGLAVFVATRTTWSTRTRTAMWRSCGATRPRSAS